MHALSVLAAKYSTGIFRICIHPEEVNQFPESPMLALASDPEMFPVHKDEQVMLRARKKHHTFIFDLPTGNFRFSEGEQSILKGSIQTGKFGYPWVRIHLRKGDRIYGFGAACEKSHLPCPSSFTLMNQDTLFYGVKGASYSSFPVFWIRSENEITGVFLHTAWAANVKLSQSDRVTGEMDLDFTFDYTNSSIPVDMFIFQGSPAEIASQISSVTGRPFLPPVWSLGYHQSRWSYRSQSEVLRLAGRFETYGIPCDAIHLDIDYMDRFRIFTWDRNRFPDPESMNNELYEKGIRTVAIVDPGISADSTFSLFREAVEKDILIKDNSGKHFTGRVWPGKTVFPDFTDPAAVSWWALKHDSLLLKGVSGIWNDMNEPVFFAGKKTKFFKEKPVFRSGEHGNVRNIYANLEAEATSEAFRLYRPDERPFILTRAAAPGMQKYAALWTGDNHSSWEHLRMSLHQIIHLGLSGMPFAGADTGGFCGGKGISAFFKFIKDPELFIRWMELSSVLPLFRNHTIKFSYRQEPWSFGPDILEKARLQIRRRYLLLPYLYSLFHESHLTGLPIIRPLFFEFGNAVPEGSENHFMIGPRILAAPVTEKGRVSQNVHLPRGQWTEFSTGKVYQGSASYNIAAPPGHLPLFIREGSVIPLALPGKNAENTLKNPIILEIYPGPNVSGRLYLDDGISLDYQKGKKLEMHFSGTLHKKGDVTVESVCLHDSFSGPNPLEIRIQGKWKTMITAGSRKEFQGTEKPAEECSRQAVFSVFTPDVRSINRLRKMEFIN